MGERINKVFGFRLLEVSCLRWDQPPASASAVTTVALAATEAIRISALCWTGTDVNGSAQVSVRNGSLSEKRLIPVVIC